MGKVAQQGCVMTTAPDATGHCFDFAFVEQVYLALKARRKMDIGGIETPLKGVELRVLADGIKELWITWESAEGMIEGYTGFSIEEKKEE